MARQHKPLRQKLIGYYAIPHELLHVLAYRLIGKPCRYEWGSQYVRALAPEAETRQEKLFILLFPLTVFWGLGLLCHLLWIMSAFFIRIRPEQYFTDGPTWHLIFLVLGAFFIFYGGTAHLDLILAYRILFGHEEIQEQRPEPHGYPDHEQRDRNHP